MEIKELLQKFCGNKDFRPNLGSPFKKDDFVYATNGHVCIRVPAISAPDVKEMEGAPPACNLYKKERNFIPLKIEDIRDILRQKKLYKLTTVCPECETSDVIFLCETEGKLREVGSFEKRVALNEICDVDYFYLQQVAETMEFLGGEWELSTTDALAPIHFKGEKAHIVLMGLRKDRIT